MCKCNPSLRTPWCGKGDCVAPTDKPKHEPVCAKIPLTELISMRQSVRNAISPQIQYKTDMPLEDIIKLAEKTRVSTLSTINDKLNDYIGDGM